MMEDLQPYVALWRASRQKAAPATASTR